MTTYIVSVSWIADNDDVREFINSYGESVYLFDNTFLLNSEMKSVDIRDSLRDCIDDEDISIYVSRLSRGSAWTNLKSSNLAIKALYNNGEE